MTLRTHVDRYVALKRHLGFKFLNNERMLRSWAAWAMARGDDVIVVDTMIGWACDASSSDTARKRLSVGRRFAVWLHAEDDRHEIPPKDVLGRATQRRPAQGGFLFCCGWCLRGAWHGTGVRRERG